MAGFDADTLVRAKLLPALRDITDPLGRLFAARDIIVAHDTDELALRDERDALIYAGLDHFRTVATPGAWRGVGAWRKTAVDISGISNRLFHRIEQRRVQVPGDSGYWREIGQGGRGVGRRGTELRHLPGVTIATGDPREHWERVRDLHLRAEEHAKVIKAVNHEVRIPTLWQIMATEPSNTALIEPSGLTYKRIEQIRADGRACGVLPPAVASLAG